MVHSTWCATKEFKHPVALAVVILLQGVQGQQPCVLEISKVAYFILNQYYTMHTCTCPFSILI